MKRNILPWTIVACVISYVALSQTEPTVQWQWQNGRIIERYSHGKTLQFGLHPDGTVVWREVVAETNSPAESRRSRTSPRIVPALTNPPPLP